MSIFGKNVKRLRIKAGYSQEILAEICGTSKNYISQIESAKRFASASMIEKLVKGLNTEPYELFIDIQNHENKQLKAMLKKKLLKIVELGFEDVLENRRIY